MQKKFKNIITLTIFVFLLFSSIFATTFDPNEWKCIGKNPDWPYLAPGEVRYNPDDQYYYQRVVCGLPYDPSYDRYNSNDYIVLSYDLISVNDLPHIEEKCNWVSLGTTPNWQYLPPGEVAYDQATGIYSQKRTWNETVGTVPGTHGCIDYQTLQNMQYLNGSLVKVFNVLKNNVIIASAYLAKGNGDNALYNKVVLLADGYDPGNERKVQQIITDSDYNALINNRNAADNFSPINYGYDLVFIDFNDGAGDIRDNAKAYLKILELLCERAGPNKVFAGGFSMGSLVSRLALLYGQKTKNGIPDAKIKNVVKYIAIDGPMQGASAVSLSLQKFILEMKPEMYWMVNNPAAKQMLYEHNESYSGHDQFYRFLKDLGNYPINMRKYSLANANWSVPYDGQPFTYKLRVTYTDFAITNLCASSGLADLLLPGLSVIVGSASCSQMIAPNIPFIAKDVTFARHDLAPGSSYDLVRDIIGSDEVADKKFKGFLLNGTDNESELKWGDEKRKPTHMPIYSVFDLKQDTPEELKCAQNQERLCREGWTPFNKIYSCSERKEHITFDSEFLKLILAALKDGNDITPILNLLLQD